jgi:hypothetical protein
MNKIPNILIVSDIVTFSTIDVFNGIMDAAQTLKMENISGYAMPPLYNIKNLVNTAVAFAENMLNDNKYLLKNKGLSDKHIWSMAFAEMMNPKYDYILFVAATCVPEWIFERLKYYGKRIIIWSTDDPHSTGMLERYSKYFDLYFTNERTLLSYFPTITHYIPMAAPPILDIPTEVSNGSNDQYLSQDIIFIGSVYPNRISLLERICNYAKNNNLKLKILGHTNLVPKDSIIHLYGDHSPIDSKVTRWYYNRSKIVINIDRDPSWSPTGIDNKWRVMSTINPESTNPRLYEVPLYHGLQVYINPRTEAKEILPNLICANDNNLEEILTTSLNLYKPEMKKHLLKIKNENYNIVAQNHTYISRLCTLIDIINKDWDHHLKLKEMFN